jgi:hypothetical protein
MLAPSCSTNGRWEFWSSQDTGMEPGSDPLNFSTSKKVSF